MKHIITFLLSFAIFSSFAQQNKFAGIWEGKLNVGVSLRIVFEFSETGKGGLAAVLRSPDQSPKPLPADTAWVSGDSIYTSAKKFGISFSGKLVGDSTIEGAFVQGMSIPLQLKKVSSVSEVKRPQTPVPPFPYNSEDVEYSNTNKSIRYGATLTWPKIPAGTEYIKAPTFPVVLLISGSGPQNRDEEILQHKPFAVIADYLTRRGFAVLRVDDRGIGKTTGNFATATSADFANDVEAGINYLKTLPKIDTAHIGLIGHSEGGMIAPMVASRRKDIKFIVLLAGPGIPITKLMEEQITEVAKANGISQSASELAAKGSALSIQAAIKGQDSATISKAAAKFFNDNKDVYKKEFEELKLTSADVAGGYIREQLATYKTPWYKYFLAFDPKPYLQKLSCDVLALNGEKDVQVLPASNLEGISAALKKSRSKKYEVKQLPGLNHLFQTCKKCSPEEYGELEETFSPDALKIIGDWLEAEK